jgi:hypothetical protein
MVKYIQDGDQVGEPMPPTHASEPLWTYEHLPRGTLDAMRI